MTAGPWLPLCHYCRKPVPADSPYSGHHVACANRHRLRMRSKTNSRPWQPGGPGRPPKDLKGSS